MDWELRIGGMILTRNRVTAGWTVGVDFCLPATSTVK
jgi:hypothetical protein